MLREVGDDFQADAVRQGTAFEQQAKAYLGALGFELHGRQKFTDIGCEVPHRTRENLAASPADSPPRLVL